MCRFNAFLAGRGICMCETLGWSEITKYGQLNIKNTMHKVILCHQYITFIVLKLSNMSAF